MFGDGEHYLPRPKSDDGWFVAAVKRAGVQAITPHDWRHTCASLAVSAGVNVLALARMLGHSDPSVTLRVYADRFDTDLDAVAAALDAQCAQSVPKRHLAATADVGNTVVDLHKSVDKLGGGGGI